MSTLLISLKQERDTLEMDIEQRKQSSDSEPKEELRKLQRRNSQLKCVANLVESFSNVSETGDKDESFFFNLM